MMRTHMNKATILTGLMACTMLSGVFPAAAAPAASKAVTSWQVSRVASIAQGSYCAMTQKFDNDSILTFAQNNRGEYSLAIESAKARYEGKKTAEITLAAQGTGTSTYDAKVQSPKAVVVGFGKGDTLMSAVKKSGVLNIGMDGKETSYQFGKYADAQNDMQKCLANLQATTEKSAKMEETAVKGITSAAPKVEKNRVQVIAVGELEPALGHAAEPSVEGLLAAKPSASLNREAVSVAGSRAEPPVSVRTDVDIIETTMDQEMATLREENARLKRSLSESRKAFEEAQAKQSGPAVEEMRSKIAALEAENKDMALKVEKSSHTTKMGAVNSDEAARVKQAMEALKTENATLKNQIAIATNVGDKSSAQSSEMASQVASLTSENNRLKVEIEGLKKISGGITPDNLEVRQNMKALEDRIALLRSENADLRLKLSDNKVSRSTSSDEGGEARLQLREARSQVELMKKENADLEETLAKLQKEADASQLKSAGGSWDLEQATRRYQESQREIRRLGALVDETNAKCMAEKKDIEYMLFDPEIAKSAQISMLNNLEDQILQKDKKIRELESKNIEKVQVSQESIEKVALLERKVAEENVKNADLQKQLTSALATITANQASAQQAMVAETKKANESQKLVVDNLNGQLKIAGEKQIALETQLKANAEKYAALESQLKANAEKFTSTESQLKAANDKVTALEKQLQDTNIKQAESKAAIEKVTSAQNNSLAVLGSQLKEANDKVVLLEGQLAQSKADVQQARMVSKIETSAGQQVGNTAPASPNSPVYQKASLVTSPVQAAGIRFMSASDIANLLASTGLTMQNGVQPVTGGDPATYRAFSWKTDSMFGSAEMRAANAASSVQDVAKQYLTRAKSRCQGDFAADQSLLPSTGGMIGYEIACVGQSTTSSASVLITYADGVVTTIAHEGRAEAMDMVMDTRDKLVAAMAR